MTSQDPMWGALSEAGASLMRTLGIILLIIVVPIALLVVSGMLFSRWVAPWITDPPHGE